MTNDLQDRMWEVLTELDADTVVRLFVDYHGMRLLSSGFCRYLKEMEIMYDDDDEKEEDIENSEEDN